MSTIPIHLVDADGRIHDLQGKAGQSLMRAAVDAGIEGIKADCGGLMNKRGLDGKKLLQTAKDLIAKHGKA